MEKKFVYPCIFGVCMLVMALFGCASAPVSEPEVVIQDLTPEAIEVDIGGLDRLKDCQFFLSTTVVLRYTRDIKEAGVVGGIAHVERTNVRRKVTIPADLPGILQPVENSGGRSAWEWGVRIVFEDDDDACLEFSSVSGRGLFTLDFDQSDGDKEYIRYFFMEDGKKVEALYTGHL